MTGMRSLATLTAANENSRQCACINFERIHTMATSTLPQRRAGISRGRWMWIGIGAIVIAIVVALLLTSTSSSSSAPAVSTNTVSTGNVVASVAGSGTVA